MAAGTAYAKRYAGGFIDGSGGGTPIDSVALNALETALLQLIGAAPTADGQVAQWDNANTRFGPALILNKNVDPAAAIAKSKLDLTGANGIVNADVAAAAAIARSKLDFGSGLVNADIAAGAAIAASKLAAGIAGPPGTELDYVEFTADKTGAVDIVTGAGFTGDGTTAVIVEFFAPSYIGPASAAGTAVVSLKEGATDLGIVWQAGFAAWGTGNITSQWGVYGKRKFVPSAAPHTYKLSLSGSGTIKAGAGGAATLMPGFIRVTRA